VTRRDTLYAILLALAILVSLWVAAILCSPLAEVKP
jgi:hypothetical protein